MNYTVQVKTIQSNNEDEIEEICKRLLTLKIVESINKKWRHYVA